MFTKIARFVGKYFPVRGSGKAWLRYGKPLRKIHRRIGDAQDSLVELVHGKNAVSFALVAIGYRPFIALKRLRKAIPKRTKILAVAGIRLRCQPNAQPKPKAMVLRPIVVKAKALGTLSCQTCSKMPFSRRQPPPALGQKNFAVVSARKR